MNKSISDTYCEMLVKYLMRSISSGRVDKFRPAIQTPPFLFKESIFRFAVCLIEDLYSDVDSGLKVTSMHAYIDFASNRSTDEHETLWHAHPSKFSALMHLRNPECLVTEFEDGVERLTAESLVWQPFDGTLIHRPKKPKTDDLKIVLSCDLSKIN